MVYCVAFSPDGSLVAATSWNRAVAIWDARDGHEVSLRKDVAAEPMSVAFLSDSRHAVFGANYRQGLFVFDTQKEAAPLRHLAAGGERSVRTIVGAGGDMVFINGEWDGLIRVYDCLQDELVATHHQSTRQGATHLAISPDGRWLAACGGDADSRRGYVQIWEVDRSGSSPSGP
jgi:WD40 repeat protein